MRLPVIHDGIASYYVIILLLQDNLASVFDEAMVIEIFSYCIIATRVAKILGNVTIAWAEKHQVDYASLSVRLSLAGIVAAACGLVGVVLTNMPAPQRAS